MGTSSLCNEHEQRGAGHRASDRGMGQWRAAAWIASVGLATCAVCVDADDGGQGYHPDCVKWPNIDLGPIRLIGGDVSIGACVFTKVEVRLDVYTMTSWANTTNVILNGTTLGQKARFELYGSAVNACTTPPCGCLMLKADRLNVDRGELFFMWKYPRHSQLTFTNMVYHLEHNDFALWFNFMVLEASVLEFIRGSMTRSVSPGDAILWLVEMVGSELRDRSLLSFKNMTFASNLQGALTTPSAIFQFLVGIGMQMESAPMSVLSNSVFEVVTSNVTSNSRFMLLVFAFQSPSGFNVTDDGAFVIDRLQASAPGTNVTLVSGVSSESLQGSSVPWLTVRECVLNFTGTMLPVVSINATVAVPVGGVASKPIIHLSKNRVVVSPVLVESAGGAIALLFMPRATAGVLSVCDNEVNGVNVSTQQWQAKYAQAVDKYCNKTFPYPERPNITACATNSTAWP